MRRAGLLFALVIGRSMALLAQQETLFDHVSTADGLPSDEVHALFEDRDGYIWAGTGDGLARMEGTRIRVFHHDPNDSISLAHDQVNGITQSSDGTLWLATMNGLSRFAPRSGTFMNQRIAATGNNARQANRMRQVLAIGDSLLWVVSEAGLYRYDIKRAVFSNVQGLAAGMGPAGTVNANAALHWDAERTTLWAATLQGLASWNANTGRWTDHRTTNKEPWTARTATDAPIVHDDALWFFRNKPYTLFSYDLRTGHLQMHPDVEEMPNKFTLRCQAFDPDGRHWMSTWTHRLFQRERNGVWHELKEDGTGLPSARVGCMLLDRSGDRWFGTSRGIALLNHGSSANTLLPFDASPSEITTMRAWGTDTLLVGTSGGGIHIVDLGSGTSTALRLTGVNDLEGTERGANLVNSFGRAMDQQLLVCTAYGLAELDVRRALLRPAEDLMVLLPKVRRASFTFACLVDSALWLGTWSRGLWRVDPRDGSTTRVDTMIGPYGRIPGSFLLSWLTTRNGEHWIGLNNGGGLAHWQHGKWVPVLDGNGASVGGVVRCMAEAPDGRLWLGTHEQGIVIHDPRTGDNRFVTRRDGLPSARLLALHFLRNGTLWASTPRGLAYMPAQGSTFQPFPLPSALRGLSHTPGLMELEDGRVAIGMGGRILLHDPVRATALLPPTAVFTGYRVNDESSLGPPEPLVLEADRKALTLELGALGTRPGHSPVFRYRIAPRDTAWTEIGSAQRIDLFDLAPGSYNIAVQASSNGVLWSQAQAQAAIEILPPFHTTWWFRSLVVAFIILLAFVGFRLYLADRLREQREAFEREQAVLAERMRIAGDMHDDLGAGLSGLKLRSEMALRVEKDPVKREQLGSLANTAGELIGSMRQIIWTMNADQTSLEDLVVYTTNYARTYCEQNALTIAVDARGPWPDVRLNSEQRRNIFLVVKEALHNIVKHAHASSVELHMNCTHQFHVELSDNGVGLPKGTEDAVGNGLRNMRKRITSLGGTLSMNGEHGTRIRFHVPIIERP
ncbi:MAG: hypothetical protein IPN85_00515 [Flavobacteriales bacterium]|nr:hypothetical protein [Flavobacteriales bacterium]MBK9286331.1 hypothetical protein [Flavobacteriales bacterium]MBL0034702.1 hypothetical protein [Flavobacteriales bacterium]